MIRINLLPVRVSKKKEAGKNQLILFVLVLILGLIGNFLWSDYRAGDLKARQDKLKRTKDEVAQLERIIGEVTNIKAEQAALRDKLQVLEKLKAGRQGPVRLLDELASVTPKKLWLRKLDEKGGAVAFEGSAATIEDVSEFMSALRKSQHFSNVELKRTAAKIDAKNKLVEFNINAQVRYLPATLPAGAAASR